MRVFLPHFVRAINSVLRICLRLFATAEMAFATGKFAPCHMLSFKITYFGVEDYILQ